MLYRLRRRVAALEIRAASCAEKPKKSFLPDWLLEDFRAQGVPFDSYGRPDFRNAPVMRGAE